MRPAHPTERAVGIDYYASDVDGTGGRLRERPEDFRVTEIEAVDVEPLAADPAVYDHLVVRATLRNWDTNDVARALSYQLGISRERIAWAGTKDKRAVTTQLISIAGVSVERLPSVAGVDLEPVGRLGRGLRLGDLVGNEFSVVVADPERPEQIPPVSAALSAFGGDADDRVGVPNFFGHQRFGSRRPVTHRVGRQLVRGDWEGAVMAYLGNPEDTEPEATRAARRFVEETRDWAHAAERFPSGLSFERALCHALADSGGEAPADFRAALEALPRALRRLFVSALQSDAFNRILSRRLERGLPFDRAVGGDVVCFAETRDGVLDVDADRSQRVTTARVDTVNRHISRGRAVVTAPLIGTETDLAAGEPGEIERSVLEELDLAVGDFDLPEPYGSTGTRRAVVVRSDLETEADPMTLAFSLPSGSYATVLLREYLKVDPQRL